MAWKNVLSTKERGYGAEHARRRAELAPLVEQGDGYCWRCGRHIPPGTKWHLGHDDNDRRIWRGIECVPCNLSAAGRKGHRLSKRSRARPAAAPVQVVRAERDWS